LQALTLLRLLKLLRALNLLKQCREWLLLLLLRLLLWLVLWLLSLLQQWPWGQLLTRLLLCGHLLCTQILLRRTLRYPGLLRTQELGAV